MPAEPDLPFTTGTQIGDYLIGEPVSEGTNTTTWNATQISVQREVILCALADHLKNDPELREGFIADVRTKASIDHPLIGSVLEAVNEGGLCFFALEKLHGTSLADCHENGTRISPIQAARIIRNISGAYKYLETRATATLPLLPHDIFVDDKFHCRIANMTVSGESDPEVDTEDKAMIGNLLKDLLEPDQPGSTRTNSLCDHMVDINRDQPLTWTQIHDLSDQVERQLAEPMAQAGIQSPTMEMQPKTSSITIGNIGKIAAAIVIIAILGGLGYHLANRKPAPKERSMPAMVRIPAGQYPGPDGFPVKVREFWIDAHEVTISEYAKFLQALDDLSENNKTAYDHENQPQEKTSHEPDDWSNLYAAAKAGEKWNSLHVDLNYPIVGIDWWDAYAYAEWKGRRLPTREEWYAACSVSDDPSQLKGTGWNPVDQTEKNHPRNLRNGRKRQRVVTQTQPQPRRPLPTCTIRHLRSLPFETQIWCPRPRMGREP